MWNIVKLLLSGHSVGDTDSELIRSKLARPAAHRRPEPTPDDHSSDENPLNTSAATTSQMLSYWNSRSAADSNVSFTSPEPHVARTMNTSEVLMLPGSAESFSLVRPHPLDELNERRSRSMERTPSEFMKKTGTHKRLIA